MGMRERRIAQRASFVDRQNGVGRDGAVESSPLEHNLEPAEIDAVQDDRVGDDADRRLLQIDAKLSEFRLHGDEVFIDLAQRLRTRRATLIDPVIHRFELPAKVGKRSAELSSTATFRCAPTTRSSVIQQSPRAIAAIPGCSGQLTRFHRRRP
jgi:hypothetical protein